MKKLLVFYKFPLIFIVFAALLLGCGQKNDISEKTLRLSDYQGKWVLINYWASWCEPCHKEIPELNRFYSKHHNQDAIVLGVSYDLANPSELKKATRDMGIQFPVLDFDPASQFGVEEVAGLPATFVINPEGKLVNILYTPQTQKSLEKAIGEK